MTAQGRSNLKALRGLSGCCALAVLSCFAAVSDTFQAALDGAHFEFYPLVHCQNAGLLARAAQGTRGFMRTGIAWVDGKVWDICWYPVSGGVYLLYPDGDTGQVPSRFIKPKLDI